MLVIIDYGAGNLLSIKNMLTKIGYTDALISSKPEDILDADKLILPGVGHFDYGMSQLKKSGLVEAMYKKVVEGKTPILGICLGAQLLTKSSEEGTENGLGWIDACTKKFDKAQLANNQKIPHMGWNEVAVKNGSALFNDMHKDPRFYFVHKYYISCNDEGDIAVTSCYGHDFVAGFEKDNILGMQFHPEKSHKFGQKLLKNFINNY